MENGTTEMLKLAELFEAKAEQARRIGPPRGYWRGVAECADECAENARRLINQIPGRR